MRLVSFYGNEVVFTDDRRKIELLKSEGFKEQELPEKIQEPPKEGEPKKNVRLRKANPKRNI